MRVTAARHTHRRRHAQQGMAAVEFALIAMLMVAMLMGLLVFWRAFQAQQSLTRAAGDGARMAHSLIAAGKYYPCGVSDASNNQQFILAAIENMMQTSLATSEMPGDVPKQLRIASHVWSCHDGLFSFEVTYALPPLLGESSSFSEPTQLTEKSVVQFAPLI